MLWIRSDPSTLVSHQRQLMVQNKSTHQLLPIRGDKMTRWNGTQGHLWKWQINQHHMVHSHDYHGPNCKNVRNRKERLLSKKSHSQSPELWRCPTSKHLPAATATMEPTRHRRDMARHGAWDKDKTGTTMEEILDRLTSGLSRYNPIIYSVS